MAVVLNQKSVNQHIRQKKKPKIAQAGVCGTRIHEPARKPKPQKPTADRLRSGQIMFFVFCLVGHLPAGLPDPSSWLRGKRLLPYI